MSTDNVVVGARITRVFGGPRDYGPFLNRIDKYPKLERIEFMASGVTDAELATMPVVRSVKLFRFVNEPNVTDKTVSRLWRYPCLERLILDNTAVSGVGFAEYLKAIERAGNVNTLQYVMLRGRDVTDEGIRALADVSTLREAFVGGEGVSKEAMLRHLPKLVNLEMLIVTDFGMTRSEMAALGDHMPACTVRFQILPRAENGRQIDRREVERNS
jgi:hypothetical protein